MRAKSAHFDSPNNRLYSWEFHETIDDIYHQQTRLLIAWPHQGTCYIILIILPISSIFVVFIPSLKFLIATFLAIICFTVISVLHICQHSCNRLRDSGLRSPAVSNSSKASNRSLTRSSNLAHAVEGTRNGILICPALESFYRISGLLSRFHGDYVLLQLQPCRVLELDAESLRAEGPFVVLGVSRIKVGDSGVGIVALVVKLEGFFNARPHLRKVELDIPHPGRNISSW